MKAQNSDNGSEQDLHKAAMVDLPPPWKSGNEILLHSVKGSLRALFITLSVKGGISFVLTLRKILAGKVGFLSAFQSCFFGDANVRTAKTVGSFALIWKLIVNYLYFTTKRHSKLNGAIAGFFAGLAILFESKENRIGYAQNVFFRSLQAGKGALKQRQFPLIPHGDSLLFCLGTASIVYAYGFWPTTIPREYYSWLIKTCRVPKASLNLMKDHYQQVAIKGTSDFAFDMEKLKTLKFTPANQQRILDYLKSNNGSLPGIPCALYHPGSDSCVKHGGELWFKVFADMFPVYFSLIFVPLAVLRTKRLLKEPVKQTRKSVLAAARSTIFLSSLIVTFKWGMCSYYNVLPRSSTKAFVYPMSLIAALWIFFEDKAKRVELALFCAPKALQSVYTILIDKKWLKDLHGIEVPAAMFSMSVLMSLYQLEPHHISTLLYKVMKATIGTY